MGFKGKAVNILLEGAPANVDIGAQEGLEDAGGDVPTSRLGARPRPAMSCHVVLAPGRRTTGASRKVGDDDFDIDHATTRPPAPPRADGALAEPGARQAGVRAKTLCRRARIGPHYCVYPLLSVT